jgi:glycosyltransferase involved in cell wall biosynthesis
LQRRASLESAGLMERPIEDPKLVHWLCWQPTPYNDFLFRRLSQEVPLLVHFRERVLASHPWKTPLGEGYPRRFYQTRGGIDWTVATLPLRDRVALYVVGGWDHPTAWVLLTLLRALRRRYALWTDTPDLNRHRPLLKRKLRDGWLKWVFDGAVRVFGTGVPGLRALACMGVIQEKLVNLPFFVDLETYHPTGRRWPDGTLEPIRLLSVGRVDNRLKGHHVAIQALARAARACPGVRWIYEIAGTGPHAASIRELATSLGVGDRVCPLCWVEPQDLVQIYRRSHVLIHPSPVHDPFPNAILEAMASGLGVLASDACGAAQDRIIQGENGMMHRAGSVDELAEQLVELFQNPHRLPAMGARARETAEQWPVEKGVAVIRELWESRHG